MHIFTTPFLLFLTLYLINFNAFALNESQSSKASLVDKLNSILSKQEKDKPGVSILLKKDNAVILKFSKGLANKDKNLSISSNTGFRIGSISKPFTALAIMKLVEQDKLSLDDEVTRFIPELPNSWQDITIQQLLSHRVSISNDFFSESNLHLANKSTNEHLIKFLSSNNMKVKALPFDKAIYCNSCYVLLAEVIAEVSGASFSDYLSKNIFTPAKMKNTYIIEKGISIKSSDALNYAKSESFFGINQYTTGAMAQVSSIDDFEQFIVALKQGEIISQKSLNLMTQVHADLGNDGTFGLGWIIGWGDKPFFSHGGSQDGYQSELFFYPKYNFEVVILTNGGDKTYELQSQLMRAIITYYDQA
ncbi:MAG: serine hydrolase [Thalassotalea sp.]|nr:serine hydrolase [Thalassotalea sp.]